MNLELCSAILVVIGGQKILWPSTTQWPNGFTLLDTQNHEDCFKSNLQLAIFHQTCFLQTPWGQTNMGQASVNPEDQPTEATVFLQEELIAGYEGRKQRDRGVFSLGDLSRDGFVMLCWFANLTLNPSQSP